MIHFPSLQGAERRGNPLPPDAFAEQCQQMTWPLQLRGARNVCLQEKLITNLAGGIPDLKITITKEHSNTGTITKYRQ